MTVRYIEVYGISRFSNIKVEVSWQTVRFGWYWLVRSAVIYDLNDLLSFAGCQGWEPTLTECPLKSIVLGFLPTSSSGTLSILEVIIIFLLIVFLLNGCWYLFFMDTLRVSSIMS